MGTLIQDIRYALRQMVKQPGFTAIVIVSLALGIGANTMIFSLVNALLLRSLPYSDPERIVMVWFTPPDKPDQKNVATNANCAAIRERSRSFDGSGCFRPYLPMNLSDEVQTTEAAERLIGQQFTADLTQTLGVEPVIGRWYTAEEEEPGRDLVMLISYRLWQRHYAGSREVLGKKVYIASQNSTSSAATIIGVLPQGFDLFNPMADFWYPLSLPEDAKRSPTRGTFVAARLKAGVSMAQAQQEMNAMAAGLSEENPTMNKGWQIQLEPVQEAYLGRMKSPLLLLQGVVAFVLLIACANVAGLLLAQGAKQQKELAIRAALGSGRRRIIRQLLTGNVILAIMGGVAGVGVGWFGMSVLVNSLPEFFPRTSEIKIDAGVLAFTLGLSVITGLIFGILPAIQISRTDLMDALRDTTRSTTAGGSRLRLRSAFVIVQISLALVLLVGAGLMINSFLRLYAVDPGIDPGNLTTFQIQFSYGKYVKNTGRRVPSGGTETEITPLLSQTAEVIRQRLASIPGAGSAAVVSSVAPLMGFARRYPFTIDGKQPSASEQEAQSAEWYPVSSHYFETLKIPMLRGREFGDQDSGAGLPVAIINSAMAKRFWPNEDPIGRVIQFNYYNEPPRQIVGIAGDVRQNLHNDLVPQIYFPMAQLPVVEQMNQSAGLEVLTFVVRSKDSPAELTRAFHSIVDSVDRTQPIFHIQPLEQYVSDQLQGFRQYVLMLGVFGGIAVILALVGIYGIMAHSVSQRTNEIGIRIALGAGSSQVLGLILRRGMILIGIGLAVGFGASVGLTRLIQAQLWGVQATDPLTFTVVIFGLGAIALLACYVPARRALRVDPAVALRVE